MKSTLAAMVAACAASAAMDASGAQVVSNETVRVDVGAEVRLTTTRT